jgi:hypothetical protein
MLTFDCAGATSDADVIAGRWAAVGKSNLKLCECPSLYPLPAATPGFEDEYAVAARTGTLPTHVHKYSCGPQTPEEEPQHYGAYLDWWQVGTYNESAPLNFSATPGWEDVFAQKPVDAAFFYASKDNAFPSSKSEQRRINWGWAILFLHSGAAGPYPQSLPRLVTFNPVARQLEQPPIEEIKQLRGPAAYAHDNLEISPSTAPSWLGLPKGIAKQAEFHATFVLPDKPATLGFTIGAPRSAGPAGMSVNRSMPGYIMSGWGSYGRHNASLASDCQLQCDADPKCVMWSFAPMAGVVDASQCTYNSNSVHRQCPFSAARSTLGFKNTTRLPGCVSNTSYLQCSIEFTPQSNASAAFYEVPVTCGGTTDTLRLLSSEKTVDLQVFADHSFLEAFFQRGRVAMTVPVILPDDMARHQYLNDMTDMGLISTLAEGDAIVANVSIYPMTGVWANHEEVRDAARVYPPVFT